MVSQIIPKVIKWVLLPAARTLLIGSFVVIVENKDPLRKWILASIRWLSILSNTLLSNPLIDICLIIITLLSWTANYM